MRTAARAWPARLSGMAPAILHVFGLTIGTLKSACHVEVPQMRREAHYEKPLALLRALHSGGALRAFRSRRVETCATIRPAASIARRRAGSSAKDSSRLCRPGALRGPRTAKRSLCRGFRAAPPDAQSSSDQVRDLWSSLACALGSHPFRRRYRRRTSWVAAGIPRSGRAAAGFLTPKIDANVPCIGPGKLFPSRAENPATARASATEFAAKNALDPWHLDCAFRGRIVGVHCQPAFSGDQHDHSSSPRRRG